MLKNRKFKLILTLIVITFFAYFSSLSNPFIWDDEQFINRNIYVQYFDIGKILTTNTVAGAQINSNYYRPLTSLSFAVDVKFWRNNPVPFHIENLSFHIGSGVLLFYLLLELGMGEVSAFFVSLFFLIFPSQTEAVSYINSRGDSLFSLLLLGSLLCWVTALKNNLESVAGKHNRKKLLLLLSAGFFILSILAKETALFTLPLFLVILWMYRQKSKETYTQLIKKTEWCFFAMIGGATGVYVLLRMTVLNFKNTFNFYDVPDIYSTHLFIRLFTFCKILFVYVGILLWPYPLHMERNVSYVTTFFSGWVIGAVILIIALLAAGISIYKKTGNFWVLFGFLWSAIFLIPVSGFIPINGLLYEHWLYMPMVGFFLMLYGFIKFVVGYVHFLKGAKKKTSKILIYFAVLLASLYIVLTIRQNNIWSDPVTFFQYTLQFAPTSARLHNNLGNSYTIESQYDKAILEYLKAVSLAPNDPQVYNNLGDAYYVVGRFDIAEKYLLQSLKIAPQFFTPRANLVKVYLAIHEYDKARKISGNNPIVEQLIKQVQQQNQ